MMRSRFSKLLSLFVIGGVISAGTFVPVLPLAAAQQAFIAQDAPTDEVANSPVLEPPAPLRPLRPESAMALGDPGLNNGVFELDANAVPFNYTNPPTTTTAAQDWFNIYSKAITPSTIVPGFNQVVWIYDTPPNADTQYQSGKTDRDINNSNAQWQSVIQPILNKGDLVNAMGALTTHPVTPSESLVYLGLTRADNNGSSAFGFWLLQREVQIHADGLFYYSGTNTLAEHKVNDLLITTAFDSGGRVTDIQLYRWIGGPGCNTGCISASLLNVSNNFNAADCRFAGSDPLGCGRVNATSPITVNWPYYQSASYPTLTDTVPSLQFLEVGLNLSRALGDTQGCYSTFIAFGRASASTSSDMKDYLMGNLQTCVQLEMDKYAPPQSKETDVVTFTYVITNPSVTTLDLVTFTDSLLGNLATQAIAGGCGQLTGNETCTFNVGYTVPPGSFVNQNPLTNTALSVYVPPSGDVFSQTTAGDFFGVELFKPGVLVTKTGPTAAGINQPYTYTFSVQNISMVGVSATITNAPPLVFTTTAPGGQVTGGVFG